MFICLCAVASFAGAEDWPAWRGPRADGSWRGVEVSKTLPPEGLKTVWRKPIGGGYAGISTAGGRIYTMDRQFEPERERVLCFDAKDGTLLWQQEYACEYAKKFDYDNGPRAAPVIFEGRVYTAGALGHVRCLNAADGKVIWKVDAVEELGAVPPRWAFAASPVIFEDLVIIQLGIPDGGGLVAFDRVTGEIKWKGSDDPAAYATPGLIKHNGQDVLLHWSPLHIQALSPRTGELHWEVECETFNGVSAMPPIAHEGLAFVAAYNKGAFAIRMGEKPQDAQIAWRHPNGLRGLMAQPMYRDGHGYMLDHFNGLTCFRWSDGEKVWDDVKTVTPTGRHPHASIIWVGDGPGILVLNSEGELIRAQMTPDGYKEYWRTAITGKTWAHPGFSGRHIFARTNDEIVCVELPVGTPD